jgi:hypothetical protein
MTNVIETPEELAEGTEKTERKQTTMECFLLANGQPGGRVFLSTV